MVLELIESVPKLGFPSLLPGLEGWVRRPGGTWSRSQNYGIKLVEYFCKMAASESQSVSPALSIAGVSHYTNVLGRPVKSAVWKFFEYNVQSEKSVCQIVKPGPSSVDAADEVCGHCIAGKYPSNLKQHLRKHHSPQYSEVLQLEESAKKAKEEADRKRCSMSLKAAKQLTLAQSLSTGILRTRKGASRRGLSLESLQFLLEAQMLPIESWKVLSFEICFIALIIVTRSPVERQ